MKLWELVLGIFGIYLFGLMHVILFDNISFSSGFLEISEYLVFNQIHFIYYNCGFSILLLLGFMLWNMYDDNKSLSSSEDGK